MLEFPIWKNATRIFLRCVKNYLTEMLKKIPKKFQIKFAFLASHLDNYLDNKCDLVQVNIFVWLSGESFQLLQLQFFTRVVRIYKLEMFRFLGVPGTTNKIAHSFISFFAKLWEVLHFLYMRKKTGWLFYTLLNHFFLRVASEDFVMHLPGSVPIE